MKFTKPRYYIIFVKFYFDGNDIVAKAHRVGTIDPNYVGAKIQALDFKNREMFIANIAIIGWRNGAHYDFPSFPKKAVAMALDTVHVKLSGGDYDV